MADLDPRALKIQELLMDEFIIILENGVEVLNKEGEAVNVRPPAPTLSVIRQFLKDNNVQAILNSDDPLVKALTKDIPTFDDDDEAHYDA